jgi:hypothetical protein
MKTPILKSLAIAIVSVGLLTIVGTTSCKKATDTTTEESVAADNTTAEANFSDESRIVDVAAIENGLGKTNGTCPAVTVDTLATPHSLTLDFGTVNCTGADGKARRGKIIVTWTGRYRQSGTVITHTFDNFYQNDNKIEGTKTVTNMGLNNAGHMYFTVVISNAKITRANGKIISWTSTRTREWIQGENTLSVADDIYSLTGSASGTDGNGNAFSVTITKALTIDFSCVYHLTSGTIDITPAGKATRTIDYGNGACDDDATLTVGTKTIAFKIKR